MILAYTNEIWLIDWLIESGKAKPSRIHGEDGQTAHRYNYGTEFDSHLKFDENTDCIVKRGQQRIYLLRKRNSFVVCEIIFLLNFYRGPFKFLFSTFWFNGLSAKDKSCLEVIVKESKKWPHVVAGGRNWSTGCVILIMHLSGNF